METSLWSQSAWDESGMADGFQIFSSLEQRHITLQHSRLQSTLNPAVFKCHRSWSIPDLTHITEIIASLISSRRLAKSLYWPTLWVWPLFFLYCFNLHAYSVSASLAPPCSAPPLPISPSFVLLLLHLILHTWGSLPLLSTCTPLHSQFGFCPAFSWLFLTFPSAVCFGCLCLCCCTTLTWHWLSDVWPCGSSL